MTGRSVTGRSVVGGELQSLVDDLAARLGRSVVIDDPGIQLVCTSRHYGDEDPVRVRAVLQRTAGSEIITFVLGQAPHRWPGAGMLAGSAQLGLQPRFCVPLRQQGLLLGYLMVIDAEQTLTAAEVDATERCALAVAAELYAEQVTDDEATVVDSALPDLLGDDATRRAAALSLLLHERLLREAPLTQVSVVQVDHGPGTPVQVESALRAVVRPFGRSTTARATVAGDRATLVQLRSRPAEVDELRAQAERMLETADSMLDPPTRPVVGIGGAAAGLGDAWISRRQAGWAARAVRPGPERFGIWDRLGAPAVLAQLPDETLVPPAVAAPLAALAAHDNGDRLRRTLRVYLDNAGSVPRTSAALHLHRTSLYYRLGQIRTATGLDLDDGPTRFLLHLALHLDELGFPAE